MVAGARHDVQVLFDTDGITQRGSGVQVREDLVLTADHCAEGSGHRVFADDATGLPAEVVWRSGTRHTDLALLRVVGLAKRPVLPLAVFDRTSTRRFECESRCYPAFKRPAGGSSTAGLAVPAGWITPAENTSPRFPAGQVPTLSFVLGPGSTRPAGDKVADGTVESWQSASGGGVLVDVDGVTHCVGVIAEREPREAVDALHVAGLDSLQTLPAEKQQAFWDLLGISGRAALPLLGDGPGRGLVRVLHLMPQQATDFVEQDVLEDLIDDLSTSAETSLVSLSGLRGVGKTQLAAAVARHCANAGWPVVAWVNAESRETAVAGLLDVAVQAGLFLDGEPAERSVARLINTWNGTPVRQRLVVFDNLTDADHLHGLRPQDGAATLLVTTADQAAAIGQVVNVDVFTPDQARDYLEKRTGLADPDGADRVAVELGYLPLALAQAAWTIQTLTGIDYDTYLRELNAQPLDTVLTREDGVDYPRSAVAAIRLSLQTALDRSRDPELTRTMYGVLAVLDPSGVQVNWLRTMADPLKTGRVLKALQNSAIAPASQDGTRVVMHRLVARVVRHETNLDQAHDTAAALLHAVDPDEHAGYWEQRREATEMATHLLALRDHQHPTATPANVTPVTRQHSWSPRAKPEPADTNPAILAAIDCGSWLTELQDLDTALRILELAAGDSERMLGGDHPDTLTSWSHLASAHKAAGDLGRAVPMFQKTLSDRERVLGLDHPSTLTSRSNLAVAYWSMGDLGRAIPLLQETLADEERLLGADHPGTLGSRSNLALAYWSKGDLGQAISLLQETLAHRERVLGADHPHTLSSRSNLAAVYESAGDLGRAILLHQETSEAMERVLGADHPHTLASRSNLALAYWSQGDLGQAIPLLQETLGDRERVLGADHPETLISRSNLALAYQSADDLGRAIPLFQETSEAMERVLGADHPDTLISRSNLAGAYRSAGDLERAMPLYQSTLADRERALGADHPNTLTSRSYLAGAYLSMGDLGQAIRLFRETLADRERVLSADHPDTLTSRNNLAAAYESAGNLGRAIPLFQETLTDRERVLGADHPDTLSSREGLALALAETGNGDKALALARLNVAESQRLFGPDDARTLDRVDTVAYILYISGNHAAARDLWVGLLARCEATLSAGHSLTARIHLQLSQNDRTPARLRARISRTK